MSDFYKEQSPPALSIYGIEFFSQKKANSGVVARAHIHPAIEFLYISTGIFEIGIDGERFIANVGDLVLFRANAIHTTRLISEGEGEYYVLKINPTLIFQFFHGEDSNECIIPFIHKSERDISFLAAKDIPNETRAVLEEMICEYNRADEFFYASERAYAARLLISLLRSVIPPRRSIDDGEISEKTVSLIHESVKYINENYAADITPTECAASIHLSYSYFAKLFRAVMGRTFKEYLTEVRLAKAHNILLSTSLPITDVATACGYGNLSYFISEYRKAYGKTPRDTRKEFSGNKQR